MKTFAQVALFTVMVAVVGNGCEKRQNTNAGGTTHSIVTTQTATGIEMSLIPAGSFAMGDANGADDEQPVHQVSIAAIWMDRYEVTQEAYAALMGKNPAKYKDDVRKPVEQVSWVHAITYCNSRSRKEGLTPCYDLSDPANVKCDFRANGYRLPTEAEWEYACRAGTKTAYAFGSEEIGHYAVYEKNSNKSTAKVGSRKMNAFGLYDMHGNVAEWCHDYYAEKAYSNPSAYGPEAGEERVLRGGSWKEAADACRSAARKSAPEALADACFGYDTYGFRCVRNADPQNK